MARTKRITAFEIKLYNPCHGPEWVDQWHEWIFPGKKYTTVQGLFRKLSAPDGGTMLRASTESGCGQLCNADLLWLMTQVMARKHPGRLAWWCYLACVKFQTHRSSRELAKQVLSGELKFSIPQTWHGPGSGLVRSRNGPLTVAAYLARSEDGNDIRAGAWAAYNTIGQCVGVSNERYLWAFCVLDRLLEVGYEEAWEKEEEWLAIGVGRA